MSLGVDEIVELGRLDPNLMRLRPNLLTGLRRDETELGIGIGSGTEWCACFGFGTNTVCHSTSSVSRTHKPTSPFQMSHPLS